MDRDTAVLVGICLAALIGVASWSWALQPPPVEEVTVDRPVEVEQDGYVHSDSCRGCHPEQYATWAASYHKTMTQKASPKSVLGPFDGRTLTLFGQELTLTRDGDRFLVSEDGAEPRPVVLTTGSHNMQVYWLPAAGPDNTVEPMPWVWLLHEQRWIPANSSFLKPPMDSKDRETGRWNKDCIRCHATHGVPGMEDGTTVSTAGELGIACEACHGPGDEHLAANADPARRYLEHLGPNDGDATVINPQRLDHVRSTQVCGNCHGLAIFQEPKDMDRWLTEGYRFRPGDDLTEVRHNLTVDYDDAVVKRVLEEQPFALQDRFWSDGMIRVGGREYAGLARSPCHTKGTLSCVSCHELHLDPADERPLKEWLADQLDDDAVGDGACVGCHKLQERQGTDHTHHEPGTVGARCYDCHMPPTTWGLLKGIRQHEIDSPTVAASLETGRPNACNLCHLDETLAWTAEHLEAWTGDVQPELTAKEQTVAAGILWTLEGEAGQRALMAWAMGWEDAIAASGNDWMAPWLGHLLADPYDAVRFVAERSLRRIDGYEDLPYDFLAPPAELAGASSAVFARWTSEPSARREPELLVDADGAMRVGEVAAMAALRDDRRINLLE